METTLLALTNLAQHLHISEVRRPVGVPPRANKNYLLQQLIFCLILFPSLALFHAAAYARAEKNQDIVFLIDTSSSMRNIFDDVKRAILDFVERASPGDNIVLISFGEKVELRIRQKISSEDDKAIIGRQLAGLEPGQYYTYITGALEKGMEELRLLEGKNPDHLRTIVLLTDGKNNPPKELSQPVTFDDLLEKYPGFLKKSGGDFYYLSLGGNPDPNALSFMSAVEGASFDLGKGIASASSGKTQINFAQVFVEPVSIDMGTINGPSATVTVSLAFFPSRGETSKNTIEAAVSARFRDNPSWKTLLEVKPAAFNCSGKP
ncbi:MAG: VWA domain-containing protein, partial [Candidatus Lindowbacteria bacterium]|nr:VWA domain-containing protein [Candidatus Lindowbacteria bacterium]